MDEGTANILCILLDLRTPRLLPSLPLMKLRYALFALGLLITGAPDALAQGKTSTVASYAVPEAAALGGSTLSHVDPNTDSQIVYTVTGGGYVWGTNTYGDSGKYSCFNLPSGMSSISVEQIDIHMIRAASPTLTSYDIVIYSGAPGYDGGLGTGPGTEIYRETFDITTVTNTDPNALPIEATNHALASAATVDAPFCAGVEWSASAGLTDLTALGTDDRGLGGDNPNQWERWDNGGFYNMSQAWTAFSSDMWLSVSYASATAAEEDADGELAVSAAYPNPSAGRAELSLTLPAASEVSVVLYDLLGREVGTAHEGLLPAGTHPIQLDARTLRAGTYLVHVSAAGRSETQPLTIVR